MLVEAAHRIRFANQMREHIEDRKGKANYGGYEFAVIREVLDDVAGTLKAAADRPELV